ncbi:hypothetical protein OsJ_04446 [Oryza sativa Japonica Group]|uniref:Uncharacterized protein n=1 Tax=Oryza sativa subsp. japonica TaxID=39947 RepID=A3A0M6_ORYSJ|nr:hypothetical protein OsJ_04446 [Oryza sativa Japonica Group]
MTRTEFQVWDEMGRTKYTSSAGWGRGTALSTRLEDVGSTGGGGSAASTRVTGTVPRRDNAAPLNPRLGRVAPTRYRWERTGVTAECVRLGHGPAEWLSGSAKCKRSNT